MTKIGQRLKQERLRLKLSQSALGTSGGVETNAQGNYESGLRFPRADYLSRVAELGVDVAYVVTGLRIPAASYPQESAGETDDQHDSSQASQATRLTVWLNDCTAICTALPLTFTRSRAWPMPAPNPAAILFFRLNWTTSKARLKPSRWRLSN